MPIDLTPVFQALIALASALITAFLIPWLLQKHGAEKTKEALRWVDIFVRAAEQIYTETGMGDAKKDYVLSRLKEKGFTFDPTELDSLIEAAVHELNLQEALLVPETKEEAE